MAFEVHWYDSVCFAIVAVAIAVSVWMIAKAGDRRRHGDGEDGTWYDSFHVVNGTAVLVCEGDGVARAMSSNIGYLGSSQLWVSCWLGLHPAWLLAFRLAAAVALAGVLMLDVRKYDASIMLYYTEWTFSLVIIYFAIGTFISAHGCWVYSKQIVGENGETNLFLNGDVEQNNPPTLVSRENKIKAAIRLRSHYERIQNEKMAGFWGYLMQIIYQTSAGAVLLTDVVFWGILVPFLSSAHFSVNLIMVCMHSLNAVFLLVDTALNNLPFPWFRMAYFVFWSCIYVIFQWVLHACGFSWWPYPFLELGTPWAPLWYLCMALVHIPCYGIYWLMVKAKSLYFPKLFPNLYMSSH
ncbi:uncharacterized protein [Typha latifolia]|uniref:uncharacterized protein isoform X1 n=1 Tax=Typha latifolia TaxID=4733 RepID=UPI003C2BBCE2